MKIRHLFALTIATVIFLTACNANANSPEDDWQKFDNEEYGISFELPPTWVTHEGDNIISIATNQEALDSGVTADAGASITLATSQEFDGFSDPIDILDLFMEYLERGDAEIEKLGAPETTTIQDLPAATVTYQGKVRELTGQFKVVVISNGDKIALVFTVDGSASGEYQDTLERLMQSVSLH